MQAINGLKQFRVGHSNFAERLSELTFLFGYFVIFWVLKARHIIRLIRCQECDFLKTARNMGERVCRETQRFSPD